MKIHIAVFFILCLAFELAARQITAWTYDMLNDQATLVAIATPISVKTTSERTNVLVDISTRGTETTFKVLTILKGDRKIESFILHHLTLDDSRMQKVITAQPNLISFEPKSYKVYLVFLQKEADGRYVAVSGQTDPAYSVKQLNDKASPFEFGIPPDAKAF